MKEKLAICNERRIPVELVMVLLGTNKSEEIIPTPETVAIAVAERSEEWKQAFLRELLCRDPKCFLWREADGSWVDPDDSKQLLELGWPRKEAGSGEELHRPRQEPSQPASRAVRHDVDALDAELQQIDDVLRSFGFDPEVSDAVEKALGTQRAKIWRQREELRRLNRREADRARFLASANQEYRSQETAPGALCADLLTLAARAEAAGDESLARACRALRDLRRTGSVKPP